MACPIVESQYAPKMYTIISLISCTLPGGFCVAVGLLMSRLFLGLVVGLASVDALALGGGGSDKLSRRAALLSAAPAALLLAPCITSDAAAVAEDVKNTVFAGFRTFLFVVTKIVASKRCIAWSVVNK